MLNLMSELKDIGYYSEVIKESVIKRKSINSSKTLEELIKGITKDYKWDYPRLVQIPKEDGINKRDIYIFNDEDSIIQKVINKILYKFYDTRVNSCVFSYRKGIRTFNAAKHIQDNLVRTDSIGVKLDISNYFMNIKQSVIMETIEDLIDDTEGKELMKSLFQLHHCYTKEGEEEKELGIMPGSAISSFLANYILRGLDSYLENNTEVYARYSDDLIVFVKTEEELTRVLCRTTEILATLGLEINPKKVKRFESDETIDFLGLKINEQSIDISDSTFKGTKRLVKQICTAERRLCEIQKHNKSKSHLKRAINKINKILYKTILSGEIEHKSGRMNYIFSNITTYETLQQLDFYINDSLRFVYTGKHNKANVIAVPNKELERLGLVSSTQLYHLYKMDKDIYKNEVYLLNVDNENKNSSYQPVSIIRQSDVEFATYNFKGDFKEVLESVLNGGYFFFDGIQVFPECLDINIMTNEISINNVKLVKKDRVLINEVYCHINGHNLHLIFEDIKLCGKLDSNPSNLLRLNLASSYRDDFSDKPKRVYSGYREYSLFRRYSINDLGYEFTEDYLELKTPYLIRYCRFMIYLYTHLATNQLWDGLNYNHKFIKYKEGRFSVILKKEWITKECV